MKHILESDLALFAFGPDAVSPARRAEIEAHVATCHDCQASLDFFVVAEGDLKDDDTWEQALGSETRTSLLAYGAQVATEDSEAEELLRPFIENPIQAAWTSLSTRRRYRTGGVVRKLSAAAHSVCESDPLVALTLAETAVAVAESLADDLYPAQAVHQLRGTAWKERANAQMLLGQFPEAHGSLDHAERAYRRVTHNALGLSMVALVRAAVMYEQQRLDDAMVIAQRAELGFSHLGDDKRRMDARFLRASILFEAGAAGDAATLFQEVIDYGQQIRSPLWEARGSYALANAEIDLGRLSDAAMHFHRALVTFRAIGPDPDRIATEWGIARVVLQSGRLPEAIRRLKDVAADYEKGGMVTDAALVGLDIVEALLALGRTSEITKLAQHLFSVFRKAGMLTGALSAMAYMKDAAAQARLTQHDVGKIRTFLRRAARQPALKFAPPHG
ncbi:MAG TPA: hypothetical protein VF618_26160 [Thermoanaerobaculia bacterium]